MSATTSDLDSAVLQRLAADSELASLLPDGVHWSSAPQHATAFAVVSQETHEDRHTQSDATAAVEVLRYIVLAVHQDESVETVKAAQERIDTLLEDAEQDPDAPLVIAGYAVLYLKRARYLREKYIDDSTQLPWHYWGGIYQLWAAPV